MSTDSLFLGIDVGGTKTQICLISSRGSVVLEKKLTSFPNKTPRDFFGDIVTCLFDSDASIQLSDIAAVGIGLPGTVDPITHTLSNSPAFNWLNIDLKAELKSVFKVPLYLSNDVNFAAIGEQWKGAAAGINDFVMITIGTGIGAAIVINNQLYQGFSGEAGEIGYFLTAGHVDLENQIASNEFGFFESISSGTAIRHQALRFFEQHDFKQSAISLVVQNHLDIKAEHVLKAAGDGDSAALAILEKPLQHLSVAVSNIASLLNPELVVIGGGVAESGEVFIAKVQSEVNKMTPISTTLKLAMLGNKAGALGAAHYAMQKSGIDISWC
ncbi:ROK family protein [Gynuella sunshinyii]|uniref:Transcriptional regulator/sugar kinase n=1 Tax=Gynuella sunshinyii YC6258 TaxID=1445510 RepID=A0A0C5VUB4_9GAMM|nr:ROK family protein [Gynuella sunshinyii]AJQ93999.1 transcriptional regulator/sugar kinase [Gynuella sunshinyii YC6258]